MSERVKRFLSEQNITALKKPELLAKGLSQSDIYFLERYGYCANIGKLTEEYGLSPPYGEYARTTLYGTKKQLENWLEEKFPKVDLKIRKLCPKMPPGLKKFFV
jgi:hypothetical protein